MRHFMLAAGALCALPVFAAALPSPAQAAAHASCQQHSSRPYWHRHVGPEARVVRCDRGARYHRYDGRDTPRQAVAPAHVWPSPSLNVSVGAGGISF